MSREAAEAGSNARQRVRWARQSLDGWGHGPQDVLAELRSVAYAVTELESAAVSYVTAARDQGATWAAVGSALGVTRQAARQRYAGALRRREAHRTDWRRTDFAENPAFLVVTPRRGVWEGNIVRLGGAVRRAPEGA